MIKFKNVLPIFCFEIQVFFIRILSKIEFQNFHALLPIESLFTFSTFQSSQVIQEVCLHILNKSLGLNRKHSFSILATRQRFVQLSEYMACLLFFQNQPCDKENIDNKFLNDRGFSKQCRLVSFILWILVKKTEKSVSIFISMPVCHKIGKLQNTLWL